MHVSIKLETVKALRDIVLWLLYITWTLKLRNVFFACLTSKLILPNPILQINQQYIYHFIEILPSMVFNEKAKWSHYVLVNTIFFLTTTTTTKSHLDSGVASRSGPLRFNPSPICFIYLFCLSFIGGFVHPPPPWTTVHHFFFTTVRKEKTPIIHILVCIPSTDSTASRPSRPSLPGTPWAPAGQRKHWPESWWERNKLHSIVFIMKLMQVTIWGDNDNDNNNLTIDNFIS